MVCVLNNSRGMVMAPRVSLASGFWQRALGLLARNELYPGEGLLISPCQGVHTFFMRFPIDVVFVDRHFRVLATVEGMRPFRATPVIREAAAVLELPPGTIAATGTGVGDILEVYRRSEVYEQPQYVG